MCGGGSTRATIDDLSAYDQRIHSYAYSGAQCTHDPDHSRSVACARASAIAKKCAEHAERSTCNCTVSRTVAEGIGATLLDL